MVSIDKTRLRVVFAVFIAVSLVGLGYGVGQSTADTTFEQFLTGDGDVDRDAEIAPRADGITVIATDSNSWRGERSEGPRAHAQLVAFNSDGTVLYYDDTHTRYWDVDPVTGEDTVVEYVFADHREGDACPSSDEWDHTEHGVDSGTWAVSYEIHGDVDACTFNGVERVNLTTGETETIWGRLTPGKEATRYHDVDRVNETHLVVADIYFDGVFIVNTETDEIGWRWNASDQLSTDVTGGPYPKDWSHINDVEVLDDGRIMVSVRNHDRVVFLEHDGLVSAWTLGAEDDYEVLYEPHNPDFIPVDRGGPAVLIGDSENNRVVEYQRIDGDWQRTWLWRDARMQWPRDADRLPNGHTLITDSNGNRVFEVNRQGDVVWSINIAFPYEAERLETGDESTGGLTAQESGLETRSPPRDEQFWIGMKGLLPGKYLNGLMYITPAWMGFPELFALVVALLSGLVWSGVELYWIAATRFKSSDSLIGMDDHSVEEK